jgi:hypothetical protein
VDHQLSQDNQSSRLEGTHVWHSWEEGGRFASKVKEDGLTLRRDSQPTNFFVGVMKKSKEFLDKCKNIQVYESCPESLGLRSFP